MKKGLFFLGVFLLSLTYVFAYSAPTFSNVDLVLNSSYTAPPFSNIPLVFGESITPPPTEGCNVTLNSDWIITSTEVCDGVQVTTGTGKIYFSGGNLTLINGANVTASGVELLSVGDQVFINSLSELRIG